MGFSVVETHHTPLSSFHRRTRVALLPKGKQGDEDRGGIQRSERLFLSIYVASSLTSS